MLQFKNILQATYFICTLSLSSVTLAENSLVTQAKQLQLGTETVGIDHQKAIGLLQQAVKQNDADAMVLLAQYYHPSSKYSYLPENTKKNLDLLTLAAQKSNWEAIETLLQRENLEKGLMRTTSVNAKENYKSIIEQGMLKKEPRAYVLMAEVLKGLYDNEYSLEQCKLLYQAYQLGDKWSAGARLQECDLYLDEFGLNEQNSFSAQYAEQIKQELIKFKQLKKPTIDEKRALLDKISTWQQDDETIKIQETLQQQIKDFYIQQAIKGHSDAYIKLAADYLSDSKQSQWLNSAVKANNSTALVDAALEILYLDEDSDKQRALEYLEKAVKLNNPVAQNVLGVWYVEHNEIDKGINLFKQAAQMDSLDAMDNLARTLSEPDNYMWAVQAAAALTKSEDVLEMAIHAYQHGKGVKKDTRQATKVQQQLDLVRKNMNSLQEAFDIDDSN